MPVANPSTSSASGNSLSVGCEKLVSRRSTIKGVRITGSNVVSIETGTGHAQRFCHSNKRFYRLQEQVHVMAELGSPEVLTDRLQGGLFQQPADR